MTLLAGAIFGAGAWIVVLGARGVSSTPVRSTRHRRDSHIVLRIGMAVGASLLVLLITGWPVGALLAGAVCASIPSVMGGRAARAAAVAKIEAIATWAEMLRDTVASGAGLAEAIRASAAVAPKPLGAEVRALSLRMERGRLVPALRMFADDVADPMADLIVAALVLAASEQAGRLGELLGALAQSIREQAAMRLRVDATRARTRSAAIAVTGISLFAGTGFLVFDRPFLKPYDTAAGQLALLLVGSCFGLAFFLLARMGRQRDPERFVLPAGGLAQ